VLDTIKKDMLFLYSIDVNKKSYVENIEVIKEIPKPYVDDNFFVKFNLNNFKKEIIVKLTNSVLLKKDIEWELLPEKKWTNKNNISCYHKDNWNNCYYPVFVYYMVDGTVKRVHKQNWNRTNPLFKISYENKQLVILVEDNYKINNINKSKQFLSKIESIILSDIRSLRN
jgi:hypothetical protein